MKLSNLYTTGTVAKRNNDGSSVAYVCTKTLSELYPDLGMEFDTTILLNNGSTSELLNTGAFGQTATAYNKNNTLYHGEPSSKIQYLGCCVVREWGFGTFINLSKHLISGSSWDSNFKLRFVINVISNENIGYNDYQPFNIDESTNVVYDFNSTYVVCDFGYKKTNTTRDISGYVQNPHELDGTGTDGDTGKRICYDEYSVMATAYNKYLVDTENISKSNIGELAFVYLINGDYFLVRRPLYVPDSGYNHMGVTIDSNKYYLTIGGFKEFDNGISGFLPENDETKGAFAFRTSSSGQYVSCTNYFVTSNCAEYVLNSCGLRWVTTNSISKAKDFRDNVRLGVMDKNGIISHKEWITGESGIQASDNPNKDTSYDNIPDRPSPGGDDNSDSVDFGGMYGGGGAFSRFYIMDVTELANLRSWMNGVQLEGGDKIPMGLDPMQQIISLSEFPVDISSSGLAPENIVFRTINVPDGAFGPNVPIPATVNTGVSAVRATGGTIELDLGTVEIPRYWQSKEVPFLDYETSIECYIPFCGVFGLDCQTVMGKTLGAKLYLATATGACNCIVYTNANGTLNPVAYGSGNMSAQLPISSNQWGTLVAATYEQRMSVAQAQSGALGNTANVLMGGLLGTVQGVDMSFGEHVLMGQNIFGSVSKAGQSSGSAYIQKQLGRNKLQAIGTTFSGAFGTTAAWSLPFKAYVKITRPNAQIPDNYAHTEGIPQVRTKVLRDCQGLTICVNTDITSINATLQEKNMIVEALSNGVIV